MRPIMGCAVLLAALAGAACHTMKPVSLAQLNAIKPDRAWVTEGDHSVILVSAPQVVGDTLVGYVNGKYEEMPTSQFKQVIVQRPATSRTVLLVAVIAAGFGGMAFALTGGGSTNKFDASYCEEHSEDPGCAAL
jgi:hypothetical protein